jgi:hypothetical protein
MIKYPTIKRRTTPRIIKIFFLPELISSLFDLSIRNDDKSAFFVSIEIV